MRKYKTLSLNERINVKSYLAVSLYECNEYTLDAFCCTPSKLTSVCEFPLYLLMIKPKIHEPHNIK